MGILDSVFLSRKRKLVPEDKFDKHFRKARQDDLDSRKAMFSVQTEKGEETRRERLNLGPSVY